LNEVFPRELFKFGLTEKEAEVYVFLAKKGVLKGGELSKELNMHKAQVYHILKSLRSKGMVETTLEFPARFRAVPIAKVVDLFVRAKREEASFLEMGKNDLLRRWKAFKPKRVGLETQEFMVIEGRGRIFSKVFQMAEASRREILGVVSGYSLIPSILLGIERIISKKASRTRVQLRLLAQATNENTKAIHQSLQRGSKRRIAANLDYRSLEDNLGLKSQFFVTDEEEALLFIGADEALASSRADLCLWTDCKAVVSLLRVFFEKLWLGSSGIGCGVIRETEIENGNEVALA
jgi:sugar-specific transcriptional regulator TrmB